MSNIPPTFPNTNPSAVSFGPNGSSRAVLLAGAVAGALVGFAFFRIFQVRQKPSSSSSSTCPNLKNRVSPPSPSSSSETPAPSSSKTPAYLPRIFPPSSAQNPPKASTNTSSPSSSSAQNSPRASTNKTSSPSSSNIICLADPQISNRNAKALDNASSYYTSPPEEATKKALRKALKAFFTQLAQQEIPLEEFATSLCLQAMLCPPIQKLHLLHAALQLLVGCKIAAAPIPKNADLIKSLKTNGPVNKQSLQEFLVPYAMLQKQVTHCLDDPEKSETIKLQIVKTLIQFLEARSHVESERNPKQEKEHYLTAKTYLDAQLKADPTNEEIKNLLIDLIVENSIRIALSDDFKLKKACLTLAKAMVLRPESKLIEARVQQKIKYFQLSKPTVSSVSKIISRMKESIEVVRNSPNYNRISLTDCLYTLILAHLKTSKPSEDIDALVEEMLKLSRHFNHPQLPEHLVIAAEVNLTKNRAQALKFLKEADKCAYNDSHKTKIQSLRDKITPQEAKSEV